MAAEVQVSEVDVLKAYSGKLNGLRNDCTALAIWLDRQIRKIRKDYDEVLTMNERCSQGSEHDVEYVKERYQRAINLCGEDSRDVIGMDDMKAEQKLEILQLRYESLRQHVQDLQMKLENAGLKTQSFATQLNTLTDSCVNYVNKYAEVLDQAKNIKK